MVVNTEYKLEQPEVGYGAMYGRNQHKQNKRYGIFFVAVVFWLTAVSIWILGGTLAPNLQTEVGDQFSIYGLAIFLSIVMPIVGLFGGIDACLNYNNEIYASDVYALRAKYARTVFKKWFERRYDVKISENDAWTLMDGGLTRVWRNLDNGRTEAVQVRFEYEGGFRILAELGRRPDAEVIHKDSWNLPDLDTINFQLMVIEEPAKPRTYMWN